MKRHISPVYDDKKSHNCLLCDLSSCKKGNLKMYIESIHEKRSHISVQFVITYAQKKRRLKKHIDLIHENNKSYKCSICDHNFTKNLALDMHIESVHEKVI